MYIGFAFISIQTICVFWLEHLIHLQLRWLSIWIFLIAILSIVLGIFEGLFSPSPVIWCLSLVMCLYCFFFFVCVSAVDFWFVAPIRFWYNSLYMYQIVFSCWSLTFPISCTHTLFFSWLLSLIYLCVDDFLTLCLPLLVSSLFVIFLNLVVAFSFLPREVTLGFVVLNSLSFCLSVKLLISLLNLNEGPTGQSSPDCSVCETVCVVQEWNLSFPPVPRSSRTRAKCFGVSSSWCLAPGWGDWRGAQDTHSCRRTSAVWSFSSL